MKRLEEIGKAPGTKMVYWNTDLDDQLDCQWQKQFEIDSPVDVVVREGLYNLLFRHLRSLYWEEIEWITY